MGRLLIILILLNLSGCGVDYHLRRAHHHLKKAEFLGAKIHSDTVFKKYQFKHAGINVRFDPKLLVGEKPMIFWKDSVRTEVIIKKGKNGIDTVYVDTKCPDITFSKDVPIAVNNKIESPHGFWYYLKFITSAFIVGVIVGFLLRAIIKGFLTRL